MASTDLDLVRGTLDLLVLKALSWGPMHGLGITRWIERVTAESLQVDEGALYPALHRLEHRGWLESEWRLSDLNRRARFYRLTALGRTELTAQLSRWSRYTHAVGLVLAAESAA